MNNQLKLVFSLIVIVALCLSIFTTSIMPNTKITFTPKYRADSSDPLIAIKDPKLRKATSDDIDTVLQKYPELPRTDKFKQELAFITMAMPTFISGSQKQPDLDGSVVDSIIQNILNNKNSYVSKYGDNGDSQMYNATMSLASKFKIEPTCTTPEPNKPGLGIECSFNPIFNTFASSALTILDMNNMPWKDTYGPAVAVVIARGTGLEAFTKYSMIDVLKAMDKNTNV
jgi:hypothetical protein